MGEGLDQHSCPECQAEYQGAEALVKSEKMTNIVESYKASSSSIISPVTSPHTSERPERDGQPVTGDLDLKCDPDSTVCGKSREESAECKAQDGFHIGSPEQKISSDQEKRNHKITSEMEEAKLALTSQVTEMSLKLQMAERVLRQEEQLEREVTNANAQLKDNMAKLLGQIRDLTQSYSEQVRQLIEEELGPGEASLGSRVSRASKLTSQLRQVMLRAESLLTEEDPAVFNGELLSLQPHIVEWIEKPVEEEQKDLVEAEINTARVCPKMETMNLKLRENLGEIQRSLRNIINPSEVTFDPETAHPNLVLSEDLKTVTFTAVKQSYPPSPQRFISFFQVLSSQSFFEGDHCWEVELDGSPWILGLCYGGNLARSGLPSALESSQSSWCLMWLNNLLTAFEQGHSVPLKKTTVSCKLQVTLSFKSHKLSFYNISPISGKTHIYTFKVNLTEPVHLAYRMMSGQPKGQAKICS